MPLEPLTPERRRQQTRDHLLAAAAEVFGSRGFHGGNLDEVAKVAGFTKGAVYSHFKSKEDLFLALFRSVYEQEMAAVQATLKSSGVPAEKRLSDFVAMIREQAVQSATNYTLLYQEFWLYAARNPEARAQLLAVDEEAADALAQLLEAERHQTGLEPVPDWHQVARIIEVLFRGIGQLRVLAPDLVTDSLLETAVAFVARGLGFEAELPSSEDSTRGHRRTPSKARPREKR